MTTVALTIGLLRLHGSMMGVQDLWRHNERASTSRCFHIINMALALTTVLLLSISVSAQMDSCHGLEDRGVESRGRKDNRLPASNLPLGKPQGTRLRPSESSTLFSNADQRMLVPSNLLSKEPTNLACLPDKYMLFVGSLDRRSERKGCFHFYFQGEKPRKAVARREGDLGSMTRW